MTHMQERAGTDISEQWRTYCVGYETTGNFLRILRRVSQCRPLSIMQEGAVLHSLIYVSRCLIESAAQAHDIDMIVTGSIERNGRLGVRGALIFTERHFAQILEGPGAAIEELMASIGADSRHERMTVIERKPIDSYRFPDWNLAYWGDASYMDGQVCRVLEKADSLNLPTDVSNLYLLIQRLAVESYQLRQPLGRPSPRVMARR